MTFSICLHTPLIQSYCRLPVRLPVFWGSSFNTPFNTPFNTRSIPVQYLTIGFPAPSPNYASKVGAILSLLTPHTHTTHTHTTHTTQHNTHTHRHTHTHTGTRTRTNVNFDPLITWDVCLGNALRSIPPVIPPFNASRSIPPFNTLLNRRLPHIHRGPGVLTHTHICMYVCTIMYVYNYIYTYVYTYIQYYNIYMSMYCNNSYTYIIWYSMIWYAYIWYRRLNVIAGVNIDLFEASLWVNLQGPH